MPEADLLAIATLLVLAALAAAFAWSAYRSGKMQLRGGGVLQAEQRPRLFRVLLALRATTVLLLLGLALCIALRWLSLAAALTLR